MFERTKNLQLSFIKQMEIRAQGYPDVVSLAQGIPSFDTPPGIKRRVENAMARGVVAKYSVPPGLPELRELIEISLAREGMFYDWQKEIIVTAGSIEGLTAALLAITKAGDEIIVPEPSYASYRELIYLTGCQPIFVPLDEERGWTLDIEKIAKAITRKTRAIFFCNPVNPTGTVFSKKDLLELAKLAQAHDLFILTDEVYKDFVYDGKEYFSLAQLPELRHRLIRAFSFSKAYSMTGWRVGFIHSDESVIAEILKIHDCLVTCAPVISQYAALGALEMGERDLAAFRAGYIARRDLICQRLDRLKNVFSYVKPASAYFVFPRLITSSPQTCASPEASARRVRGGLRWGADTKNLNTTTSLPRFAGEASGPSSTEEGRRKNLSLTFNSWDFALELLDKAQVAVVPGVAFGPSGEGHVRMSFGRSEADINLAFDRIETFLKI